MKRLHIYLLLLVLAGAGFGSPRRPLVIVFLGDSITHGSRLDSPGTQAPPVWAAKYLERKGRDVAFSNQGVSGHTTVDFLPATGRDFPNVVAAANDMARRDATLVFSIMLGTNDSAEQGPNGSPVSPAGYRANLKTIIDSLLNRFPEAVIVLNRPIWYSPTTYNGARYLQAGLDRLQTYFPEIDTLVAAYGGRVFAGDKEAFGYFEKNYRTDLGEEQGHAGAFYLHPNAQGAKALGLYWGRAIERVVR
ncbi:GDSL-type esterase/lipase family protein [Dinghuibacter silviterrae]|uniref:Lysophospholipase L1-like esterase n=1 Tax=Dinghuibacter silviterrae TaxID=1539049 RepID=A0A4R8DQ61_9BACT|nr:GDSL-type esterase/lipase family protein [Dinghuibacter silviterrae]TDW99260.1 lysophospholipase L1-like esterase [Dinghuibacter silviterrae]